MYFIVTIYESDGNQLQSSTREVSTQALGYLQPVLCNQCLEDLTKKKFLPLLHICI